MPKAAILFDLDGTLHDRSATLQRWLAAHLTRFNLPAAYGERFLQLDDYGYRSKREVFPQLAAEFGLAIPVAELWDDYGAHMAYAQAMPQARATLSQLQAGGFQLGLVSNGWPAVQRECLERCGLSGFFDAIIISREAGISKPDPRIYRLALAELGVQAQDALFVGDSPRNDIWGPQQVGLTAAWLPTGHPLGDERPDYILKNLQDVTAIAQR